MSKTKKDDPNSKFKRKKGGGDGKKLRSNHSLNPERKVTGKTSGSGPTMRSKSTINRLRMYKNFKPKRNAQGKITKEAPFQGILKSGTVARVEPHRRWFGNTRVVGQEQLQQFQEEMGKILFDPFQVVMRQTRAPISLLQEKAKQQRVHILDTESFAHTFGKKAQRKKANLNVDNLESFREEAELKSGDYFEEKDRYLLVNQAKAMEERTENPTPLFKAGQSARVWSELYKVIDSSDVLLEVLDARDPMGTRCRQVEQFLSKEKPHKHLVFVLNKVDLVPNWVTKKWMQILSKEMPTIAFHASIQHSFGKGSLINLLRQFYKLHRKERKQISIGLIGYPNVGKSSVVNTLRNKKVCKTAPLAGETKVWQYVTMMKGIYLIDCPGVVYPPHGDSETDLVLKGVVRVENVPDPENHIAAVLDRVRPEHLMQHYAHIFNKEEERNEDKKKGTFLTNSEEFLSRIAIATGRLLKGGEPDLNTVARQVLNDYQRGNIPHYVLPPGCRSQSVTPSEIGRQMVDERPINLVEEDEKIDAMTDSECVPEDQKALDDEEILELKDEEVKEKDEMPWKDPLGEKAIIKEILAKREGETEDDGESSVITDFEFQLSATDDECDGLGSIGSDLEEEDIIEDTKKHQNAPQIGRIKRPRGKRAGKKLNKTDKRRKGQMKTGRASKLVAAEEKRKMKGIVNFDGPSKQDIPRNLWRKKLKKKRVKPKHQI
uniref:Nucleolar GTP-binding protein 2 n=1 Tax=Meloidogyne hapla TaxID=6305 RepID=A0A1I8BXI5_MELHA